MSEKKRNTVKRTGSGDKLTDGRRLGEFRTGVVCHAIRNLAKVGNKAAYDLTKEDVKQIMDAVQAEVIALEVALVKGYTSASSTFTLKAPRKVAEVVAEATPETADAEASE